MFYSSRIFTKVNFSGTHGTCIVGFVNLACGFFALILLSKFGRRTLMIWFSFAMTGALSALGVAFFLVDANPDSPAKYAAVVLVIVFVILFGLSLGPIPWIYMAEIMTDKGLSIAVLMNWLVTLMLAISTPYLISGYFFVFFGIEQLCTALFCIFVLKETKGLTEA